MSKLYIINIHNPLFIIILFHIEYIRDVNNNIQVIYKFYYIQKIICKI